jgi:hypothetical protein
MARITGGREELPPALYPAPKQVKVDSAATLSLSTEVDLRLTWTQDSFTFANYGHRQTGRPPAGY